ncbi:hypothetical protein [Streptomyces sp. NPDC001933]|uniref:fluoroquinolone export ABC transporter permease subunit n=1 Tax=Streptomyces sp. NPDC001933 TaxID=3364626 RepID=UPI0036C8EE00
MSTRAGSGAPTGRRTLQVLVRAVGWDLRLQLRYHIVTVAALVTALYAVALRVLGAGRSDELLVSILFSDPTMIGFLFVGVLVLFERGSGTLQAVLVTPLSTEQYLWSKAVSLTLIAVPCGTAMALAGGGSRTGIVPLVASLTLTSLLFVFIGLAGVSRARTLNEYLLLVPLFLVPMNLPLLDLFGMVDSWLHYLIPTQASLVLLQAAFASRPGWEAVYAVAYLSCAVAAAFQWARRAFETSVRGQGRAR